MEDKNKGLILERVELSDAVVKHVVRAPLIASKAKPGNFVIIRAVEGAERIPVTLVDWDAQNGTITLIVQSAGKSTRLINSVRQGEKFRNIAGPLGMPVDIKNYGTVVCVGGGVGIAEMYPIARALKQAGNKVISVMGARSKNLVILADEVKAVSDEVFITTDDGSMGDKGLVTAPLDRLHAKGVRMDAVFVIGPVIMMKVIADQTRPWGVATYASLNPIMLDGTGMCGCCRVEVAGRTALACVEGPMFNAHEVNFPLLLARTKAFIKEEKECLSAYEHECTLDAALKREE